ncbi:DUF6692 family protein [Qipengyuania sp.]|uniref:DUF6692 family protein n=1 Tax=Qipengyuania sp. TaxID=2004515 RepID=UPI0035C791CE
MIRLTIVAAVLALGLSGCNRNTAIGNDREAQVDPMPTAAPVEPAAAALANVASEIIKPETMSNADVRKIGGREGKCVFTFTEVAYPAFIYQPGRRGVIKLNSKLVPLSAAGENRYESGGLLIVTQEVDATGDAGRQALDLIVVPPGARDEIGYRGYVACTKP